MSIKVSSWLWENSQASGSRLLLLLAIADFADDNGLAWPSLATLEAKTRVPRRTVQRMISELEELGMLSVKRGDGRHSSRYRVDMTISAEGGEEKSRGVILAPLSKKSRGVILAPQGCHSCVTPGVTSPCSDCSGTVNEPSMKTAAAVSKLSDEQLSDTKLSVKTAAADSSEKINTSILAGFHPETGSVLTKTAEYWNLGKRGQTELAPSVSEALEAGHSASYLLGVLLEGRDGVRRPVAVLKARLQDLPKPGPKTPTITPKCGACNPSRWIEDPETGHATHKCPTCHPTHTQLKEAS